MFGRSRRDPLEPELRALIGILLAGLVAVLLDTTIVNVAIERLATDLHTSVSVVQWVSTGFLLALGVAIPLTAWAVSRFGGRTVWLAGVALFTLGSALAGASWDIGSLITFRVLQGLGGGLMLPVQQTLLVRAAGPARLGRVMAAISLPAVVIPILGPVVGGLILQAAGWRWIFLINVPIGAAAYLLAWRGLDGDRDPASRPLDVLGLALFTPGVVAVLYALTRVAQLGTITKPGAWAPLVAGLLLLAAFTWHAAHARSAAMMDVRLFRVPSFAASSLLLLLSGLSLYGVAFLLPLFYQQVRGYPALSAGLLLAPQGVGSLAARTSVGKLADRHGSRAVVLVGVLCALAGSLPFCWGGVHGGQVLQILGLVVRGAGLSAVNIAVMVAAYQGLSKDRIPHASSTTRILLQVGGSFGVAVAAVVLQHELAGHPGAAAAHARGFDAAFWWMTLLTLVAVPAALLLPGRRPAARAGQRDQMPADPEPRTAPHSLAAAPARSEPAD